MVSENITWGYTEEQEHCTVIEGRGWDCIFCIFRKHCSAHRRERRNSFTAFFTACPTSYGCSFVHIPQPKECSSSELKRVARIARKMSRTFCAYKVGYRLLSCLTNRINQHITNECLSRQTSNLANRPADEVSNGTSPQDTHGKECLLSHLTFLIGSVSDFPPPQLLKSKSH